MSTHTAHSSSTSNLVGVHYRVGNKIGEGSFGVIFEGEAMSVLCPLSTVLAVGHGEDELTLRCRHESPELADGRYQVCAHRFLITYDIGGAPECSGFTRWAVYGARVLLLRCLCMKELTCLLAFLGTKESGGTATEG